LLIVVLALFDGVYNAFFGQSSPKVNSITFTGLNTPAKVKYEWDETNK